MMIPTRNILNKLNRLKEKDRYKSSVDVDKPALSRSIISKSPAKSTISSKCATPVRNSRSASPIKLSVDFKAGMNGDLNKNDNGENLQLISNLMSENSSLVASLDYHLTVFDSVAAESKALYRILSLIAQDSNRGSSEFRLELLNSLKNMGCLSALKYLTNELKKSLKSEIPAGVQIFDISSPPPEIEEY
jgi:hypothetical protein